MSESLRRAVPIHEVPYQVNRQPEGDGVHHVPARPSFAADGQRQQRLYDIIARDAEWVGCGAATWSDTHSAAAAIVALMYLMRGHGAGSVQAFLQTLASNGQNPNSFVRSVEHFVEYASVVEGDGAHHVPAPDPTLISHGETFASEGMQALWRQAPGAVSWADPEDPNGPKHRPKGTKVVTVTSDGVTWVWRRFSRTEWRRMLECWGQGRQESIARGERCVVVPCDNEALAFRLLAAFNRCFSIPTCHHWDGRTVSTYGGDAGYNYPEWRAKAERVAAAVLAGTYDEGPFGPLLSDDVER